MRFNEGGRDLGLVLEPGSGLIRVKVIVRVRSAICRNESRRKIRARFRL